MKITTGLLLGTMMVLPYMPDSLAQAG